MEHWKELMAKVEREHGIVTRDGLHAGGLSPRQVARWTSDGRLVPVAHGVFRLGGVPPSHGSEVLAAIKVFPGETWASHHTAARLWGLGIVGREQRIELTRPTLLSAQRSVARIHRSTTLLPHHLTSVAGIPVTTAARTFFDLSRTTGPMRLSRAVTKATRDNLCTMGGMYRVLFDLGGRGRPGTRRMRQVLDEKGIDYVPTESELDEIGRALLGGSRASRGRSRCRTSRATSDASTAFTAPLGWSSSSTVLRTTTRRSRQPSTDRATPVCTPRGTPSSATAGPT